MTKTILITGLDGSGKSTLFSKLEAANLAHVTLVSALHVDVDTLPDNSELKKPIALLNEMNQEADAKNRDDFKAIALFCAMVLFGKLVEEKSTAATRIVVCERHPLVDTFAYAQFYVPRLSSSGSMDLEMLLYFSTKYEALFSFILAQLPIENKDEGVIAIYKFIKTFFIKKIAPDAETETVFQTSVPDKIFFLKAPPEVLMDRISSRKVIEAHEKLSVLSQLETTYDTLLEKIASDHNTIIENIDASTFENLDTFYTRLMTEIKN
jgi:thymidylate kinase